MINNNVKDRGRWDQMLEGSKKSVQKDIVNDWMWGMVKRAENEDDFQICI